MSDSTLTPEAAAMPEHLREVYALLGGRPVFLPITQSFDRKPLKGPLYDGWNAITWEQTLPDSPLVVEYKKENKTTKERVVYRKENFRALLEDPRNNFGILQGAHSVLEEDGRTYHLCSIDIDDNSGVEPFLAANPNLAWTLQTVGSRGRNFWVWCEPPHPPLHKDICWLDANGKPDKKRMFGEWRADGGQTVIYGTHPSGCLYRRDVAKPPVRIKFSDINWPKGLHLPWAKNPEQEAEELRKRLVESYGDAFEISKKGKLSINQTFFAAWYAEMHKRVFCPEEACFYAYRGETGLWSKHSSDGVRKELCTDMIAFAKHNQVPKLILACTAQLENAITQKIRGFMEKWAAFKRERSPLTNRPRALVHLLNGMLDLDTDPPQMLRFAPEFMSRNQLQVSLDPDAKCPRFLDELVRPALHADDVILLQKLAGQIILGVNLCQKIAILTGLEGRGKSTFVKVMQHVIGEVNCGELRTKFLGERFEIFRMLGKSLIVGADVPGNFMMIDGAENLKSIVGGDLKDAEPKNGNESYNVRGEFNVLITCNTRLRVKLDGDAGAWRRRLLIIPYEAPPPKRKDPLFCEKLVASEASGILNWMIEGAVLLLADVEEHGDIVLTPAQKDRVESLLAESDSVRDFVRRGCVKAPGAQVTSEEINAAYVAYCERRGWSPIPSKVVERILPDALLEIHGASKAHDIKSTPTEKAKRGFRGVRVLTLGEQNDREADAGRDTTPPASPSEMRAQRADDPPPPPEDGALNESEDAS